MTQGEGVPHLSLVVPAFNEERRIQVSLQRIGEFLVTLPYSAEVVVVDDGSAGAGRAAAQAAVNALPAELQRQLQRHEANRGKGAAVRTGALAARGHYVAFIDADLATPPEELPSIEVAIRGRSDSLTVRLVKEAEKLPTIFDTSLPPLGRLA